MKKILSLFLFALLAMSSWATIDWSSIDYAGDGAGGGAYSNKYKFYCETSGVKLVNIQKPGFATEAGLYVTFPAGISACSLDDGSYAIQGAGICLYLSAFTQVETEFTVTDALGTYTCSVYYPSAFVAEATEYGLVGDYQGSWDAANKGIMFYTTTDSKVIKATAASFTTGQWGFKVCLGTNWDNLWGMANAMSTGEATAITKGGSNIYIGTANNNVTLTNVTFTITLNDAGTPATLQVDADQTINTADFHDKYIIVGTQTGWSLENNYIEFEYQADGSYKATVEKFQGDLKVLLKDGTWNNAYSTSSTLALGDNTLTKGENSNAAFESGMVLKNGTFVLTLNGNSANLNIAGTLVEEHSYSLVGAFESWSMSDALLFTEQADGSYTYDYTAFPGGSAFKVSIDKTWTCFLAQDGVNSLINGVAYTCAHANNDNNFTIGVKDYYYDAHFVLVPADDAQSATLTVTYFESSDYQQLANADGTQSVTILPVHYANTNDYQITITSGGKMTSLGGSYCNVNGVGGYYMNGDHSTVSADGYTITIAITSTSAPTMYTPLYVLFDGVGEANFGQPTFNWIEIGATSADVNIASISYATYACAYNFTVSDATAYTGSLSGNTLTLNPIASDAVIPAGTGIILKQNGGGTAKITYVTTAATADVDGNSLVGTLAETTISSISDGIVLTLGLNASNEIGFRKPAETVIPAHKAYLIASSEAPVRIVEQSDIVTSMEDIESAEEVVKYFENGQLMIKKGDVIYNALGQIVK